MPNWDKDVRMDFCNYCRHDGMMNGFERAMQIAEHSDFYNNRTDVINSAPCVNISFSAPGAR